MSECDAASQRRPWRELGLGAAAVLGLGALFHCARRYVVARSRPAAPLDKSPQEAIAAGRETAREAGLGQILIPVANPSSACALVRLASALRGEGPAPELIALKVVNIPRGTPLEEASHYTIPMREHYAGALAKAMRCAQERGVALHAEVQVARDVATGVLTCAEGLPDLGLILLGWRGAVSLRRVRRSVDQQIVSRARAHVAVLCDRGLGEGPINKVLVPVGWGPHARLGLRLAERLAQSSGTHITVLRVLPMAGEVDWEGERAALLKLLNAEAPSLRYDTELLLARGPDVVPAILAETQRTPYDLVLVGASDEGWVRNWLFGAIPDQIAEQAPCSVLLVRRYEPITIR